MAVTELGLKENVTGANTCVITLAAGKSAAVGDLIVVAAINLNVDTIQGVTDSKGNTYGSRALPNFGGNTRRAAAFECIVTTPLVAGDTITFTANGTGQKCMQAYLITGVAASSFDKVASSANQASTTSPTTGTTAATAQADEVAIAMHFYFNASAYTPAAGYTQAGQSVVVAGASAGALAMSYKVLSAIGAQVAVGTIGTAATASGAIITYKLAPTSLPQKSRSMRMVANPGGWTREDGSTTNLPGGTNEATIDDNTYIQSPANPASPSIIREKIDPANPPNAGNQIFKTRYKQDAAGTGTLNLKHRLYQGGGNTVGAGTLVVERTFLNVPLGITEEDYVLSGGELALITDRGELYVEREAYVT